MFGLVVPHVFYNLIFAYSGQSNPLLLLLGVVQILYRP